MRCLSCGKELALLKRLRGGGEFCSDAHRQQYQEEYNQLALTRLLQAHPSEDSTRSATPIPVLLSGSGASTNPRGLSTESRDSNASNRPVSQPLAMPAATPLVREVPPAPSPKPESVAQKTEPVAREAEPIVLPPVATRPEEKGPAPLAKYIPEVLTPCEPDAVRPAAVYLDQGPEPLNYLAPALPLNESALPAVVTGSPDLAGTVPLRIAKAVDSRFGTRARSIEQRDFSHAVRATNTLSAAPCDGSLGRSQDPLEIEMSPCAPSNGAPWTAPECMFAPEIELGDLTRLAFTAAGFAEERENPRPPQVAPLEPGAVELAVEPALDVLDEPPAAASEGSTGVPVELRPEPPVETAAVVPAPAEPTNIPASTNDEALTKHQAPTNHRAKDDAPSGRATERLPVTIRTLAAGRGRPVQVFSSPVMLATEIQIPASGAMPLRPLMVLGPAEPSELAGKSEAEKTETGKPEPGKNEPEKPAVQAKVGRERPIIVRPQGQKPPSEKTPAEKAAGDRAQNDKPKLAQRPRIEPDRKPKPLETKATTPVVTPLDPAAEKESSSEVQARSNPKPISAPVTDLDLGLPELHMDTQAGFWSRLSVVGKIGIAAAIVIIATAATYMMSSGHAVATPPSEVRGSIQQGAPITDAAWVADWSPEAARRGRHISILKSSLPLTDYRMQFEAQIESKAIAWVYRAEDPQNFHVAKIEVVKPGLEPVVALVRFAVVGGRDQQRSTAIIPLKVRVGTVYKVKFEAVGNRFTTWIGDLKVGEWTDDRFTMGPPGLFNDKGESAAMQGIVNVMPLMVSNGASK